MVRYFNSWTPLVVVGTVAFLALPWLGLIAFLAAAVVTLATLAALAWAIIEIPLGVGRAIGWRWGQRAGRAGFRPVAGAC